MLFNILFFIFVINNLCSPDDLDGNIIKSEEDIKKTIVSIHLLLIGNEPCIELMNMLSGGV